MREEPIFWGKNCYGGGRLSTHIHCRNMGSGFRVCYATDNVKPMSILLPYSNKDIQRVVVVLLHND